MAFITVASMPMYSAVARSIPVAVPAIPRKMLPPPITTPISTPKSATALTSPQIAAMVCGLMPYASPPIKASPESLRRMRLYFGVLIGVPFNKLLLGSSGCGLSGNFGSEVVNLLLNTFANHEQGEASDRGALFLQQLFDSLLAISSLDEYLTQQSNFLQVFLNSAFGNLFQHGFRLAGFTGLFDGNTTFGFQQLSGNTRGIQRLRLGSSDVHRQILAQLLVATNQINHDTNLGSTVDVGNQLALRFETNETADRHVFTDLAD